jgi:chaperonin cofactor prefoldin
MKTQRNLDGSLVFIKTKDDIEKERNNNIIKDLNQRLDDLENRIITVENTIKNLSIASGEKDV